MAKEVRLPQLGETMETGTIVNCLVKVGEEVTKGTVVFEVETDKATLEVESPAAGVVKNVLVAEGVTIPVNAPMMILGEKDEKIPQSLIDSLKAELGEAGSAPATVSPAAEEGEVTAEAPKAAEGKVVASPRAKIAAKELGVDLSTVAGTGPGGRISEEDVRKAAGKAAVGVPQPAFKLGQRVPVSKIQKIVGERMLKSKREIPCFYLTVKADMTELVSLRTKMNASGAVKVSYDDFVIRAAALALKQFPVMTGQLVGEHIQLADSIDVGLAIALDEGLVAPVLKNVDKKDLVQISKESAELIEKARSNKLTLAELEGGCITVSNLGSFGIESFIAIVVPGQCSILGIGRITDTCVPGDGNIVVRKLMSMTLSVDHRVTNGAYAAQFLDYLRRLLEDTSTFK